jgi:hypothetical protein
MLEYAWIFLNGRTRALSDMTDGQTDVAVRPSPWQSWLRSRGCRQLLPNSLQLKVCSPPCFCFFICLQFNTVFLSWHSTPSTWKHRYKQFQLFRVLGLSSQLWFPCDCHWRNCVCCRIWTSSISCIAKDWEEVADVWRVWEMLKCPWRRFLQSLDLATIRMAGIANSIQL